MNIQQLGQKLQAYPALVAALHSLIAFGLTGNVNVDGHALGALKGQAEQALLQAGEQL